MSLSSQIKVPAQVKGAVGGGSGGGATSLDGLSDVAITSAASGDFLRNNGTNFVNTPLSETDITNAGGALASSVTSEASTRASADTALAAPSYVTLSTTSTLGNERVLTGTTNQITVTDGGAGGNVTLSAPQNLHTGASPQFAGIELGHANDTTITRTGAGVVAVEGAEVTTNTGTQTLSNKTLAGFTQTGAITATGTHSAPTMSATSQYRDASGNWVFNSGAGGYALFGAANYGTTTASDRGIGFIQDCSVISAAMGMARYPTGLVLQTTAVGCIGQHAKLQTRANSTAYTICTLATGDTARVLFEDSQDKQAVAKVSTSGVVTFTSDSHADYVASSSPASGEIGVYVTGGNLTIKPGSAGSRGIAAFPLRGIA